jgi:DNA-binding MarR family transcriptional regulator
MTFFIIRRYAKHGGMNMKCDTDSLKLENQLCFPIYACSHEIIKKYKPFLDKIGLTYTQYITMMVLWDRQEISARDLGIMLHLDSGTLTPLLKRMQGMGLITRTRSDADERVLNVKITPSGNALKEKAASIPKQIRSCVDLTEEESRTLLQDPV